MNFPGGWIEREEPVAWPPHGSEFEGEYNNLKAMNLN
jgi:hypothetical protein